MIEQIIVDRVNAIREDLPDAEREGLILKIWMETIENYNLIVEFKEPRYTQNFYFIVLRNRNDPNDEYIELFTKNLMDRIKFKLRKFKIESL